MSSADPQESAYPTRPDADGSEARPPQRFQFRLRTAFFVTTVLCFFLAIPPVAWVLGYLTAYIAVSFVMVAVVVAVQATFFLLFDALGWLPPPREQRASRASRRDDGGA